MAPSPSQLLKYQPTFADSAPCLVSILKGIAIGPRMDLIGADSDLLQRALKGDSCAFASLCEAHRERLWRIVTSVARGPDVEDLAQEAIVRAYCARLSYRADAPFGAWLCRIAVNVAHDYHRSAWKRRVILGITVDDEQSKTVSGEAERRERARRIRQAVAALPAKLRTPVWLRYFEEYSIAEIGRLENVAESTLRSRIDSGLKRIQAALPDMTRPTPVLEPAPSETGCT